MIARFLASKASGYLAVAALTLVATLGVYIWTLQQRVESLSVDAATAEHNANTARELRAELARRDALEARRREAARQREAALRRDLEQLKEAWTNEDCRDVREPAVAEWLRQRAANRNDPSHRPGDADRTD